ncbi:ubiquinone/menaquinone biosynthesis C-methylase UbiE [Methanococcus voltae]|uniref:class I SAM-dependent methyltransferase n=1 Tax=Methanococcus voltae TaxID=2188 RepID=UPI001FD9B81D|nr:methyltransferase domain-containing protein [Methanococcus voltae]MBP2143276.1 ubiquinone/menaquinone biosynthesis C-methylase UbiE [Methanococcus voltae]
MDRFDYTSDLEDGKMNTEVGYYNDISIIEEEEYMKNFRCMDYAVEYLNNELLGTFFRQGLKFGIYKIIDLHMPTKENLLSMLEYPNKDFILKYVNTAVSLGLIRENYDDNTLELNNEFKYSSIHPKYQDLMDDYIAQYDFRTSLFQYALIGYNHPEILLNFKKDADIWDMLLNTEFMDITRTAAFEVLDIKKGDYVLDIGCGSRSPLYFSSKVAPNGQYTGVDISKKLIKMAESRLERNGIECAKLKTLDFSETIPKTKYDSVICTHTLSYAKSPRVFLRKMMDSLKKNGKLIIIEEFFKDSANVSIELFEFYQSLNKYFIGYLSRSEIIDTLELLGYGFKYKFLGNCGLLIEKIN